MMNAMKADPARVSLTQNLFAAHIARKVRQLTNDIDELVVVQDCFGIAPRPNPLAGIVANEAARWAFLTDAAKLEEFQAWFAQQVRLRLLTPVGLHEQGKPYTAQYVESAYRRGLVRAYTDSRRGHMATSGADVFENSRAAFLRDSFGGPEAVSKLRLLNTRTFEQLKGITAQMSQDISRTLATGLSAGQNPKVIAKVLTENVEGITRKRALVMARTEIMHAHAEGQLDAFEHLGIKDLGVSVEWSTAGDGKVCPRCAEMQGRTYTVAEARGLIPKHPQCRCCFLPNLGPPTSVWGKRKKVAT